MQLVVDAWEEIDLYEKEVIDERVEDNNNDDMQLDLEVAVSQLSVEKVQQTVDKELSATIDWDDTDQSGEVSPPHPEGRISYTCANDNGMTLPFDELRPEQAVEI
jgi:hypothetical protein